MAELSTTPRRVQAFGGDTAASVNGFGAALDAHPSFASVPAGDSWDPVQARRDGVDLVVVLGPTMARVELIDTVLADGFDVLARPPSSPKGQVPAGQQSPGRSRLLPLFPDRYAPALRSAATSLAAGKIGLPWNVQLDLLLSDSGRPASAEQLLEQAAGPVDAVLNLLKLPARRVYVPAGPVEGEGTVAIQIDHDHGVLSTIVVGAVGSVPGDDGFGVPVIRNRYRISGSHGELLVDALRPRVRLSRPEGRSSHWDGPTALTGLLDAIATGQSLPAPAEVVAVQQILAAARRSIRERSPVPVGSA